MKGRKRLYQSVPRQQPQAPRVGAVAWPNPSPIFLSPIFLSSGSCERMVAKATQSLILAATGCPGIERWENIEIDLATWPPGHPHFQRRKRGQRSEVREWPMTRGPSSVEVAEVPRGLALGTGQSVGQEANADIDTRVWKLPKFHAASPWERVNGGGECVHRRRHACVEVA